MKNDHRENETPSLMDMSEISQWSFFQAIIAEFLATLLFLYVTIATVIGHKKQATSCDGVGILGIAWAFGGAIFVLVYCTANISGSYFRFLIKMHTSI